MLPESDRVEVGSFVVDRARGGVIVDGEFRALAPTAFGILWAMAQDPHRVWTQDDLYRKVWGHVPRGSRALAVHLSKLRKALPSGHIVCRYTRGYVLVGP